jgi:hypothetical protein
MRKRVKENCLAFNKEYLELDADLSYFEAMVDGPHKSSDFLVLEPGEEVMAHQFYSPITPARELKSVVEL